MDGKYVVGSQEMEESQESWYHMVLSDTPQYIEEHETRIDETLEQNPDDHVFKTTLEPGEGGSDNRELD